ncbi:MAG: hypothetical protein J6A77_06365 [Lachnospiraceae bacterium]|nr:hypothetical protein [Lachnospiraceae bacterium]
MTDNNWTPEAQKKEKKARLIAIAVILSVVQLILFVLVRVIWGIALNPDGIWTKGETVAEESQVMPETENMEEANTEQPEGKNDRREQVKTIQQMTEHLGERYEWVTGLKGEPMVCIAKKDGKFGMVALDGSVLVPFAYDRLSFMDQTGWVELQKEDRYDVFDSTGTMLYSYKNKKESGLVTETGIRYRTTVAYMSGMKIKTFNPEDSSVDFYGVEYYSLETGELLYRAVGDSAEAGVFTFPDETGRAVAIQGDWETSTDIYYITKDGCTRQALEPPEELVGRLFYFPGDYTWADIALSHGWLKVLVYDNMAGKLMNNYESYLAFLNVDTMEVVRFPEQYQGYFWIYDEGYGDWMAIQAGKKEDEFYAVCRGEEKLSGEKYVWVEFNEEYVVAGTEDEVEVLDEDGVSVARFPDAGGRFLNGKMLVYDGSGVYFVNEELEQCSDYIIEGRIDGCFPQGIVVDGWYYLVPGTIEY